MQSISVIIPLYNRRELICETLESVFSQKKQFDEIIVVDDGSTDDSADLVENQFPKARLIRLTNTGVQLARNRGVTESTSKWAVLCDSDDILLPGHREAMDAAIEELVDLDAAFVNFKTFGIKSSNETDKFAQAPPGFWDDMQKWSSGWIMNSAEIILPKLLTFQPLFQTGSLYRRSFYQRIGGFDSRMNRVKSEDLEFTLRTLIKGKVACINRVEALVRKHLTNDSGDFQEVLIGEAAVLRFSANFDAWSPPSKKLLRKNSQQRLWEALELAVGENRLNLARAAAKSINTPPPSTKAAIKYIIACLASKNNNI